MMHPEGESPTVLPTSWCWSSIGELTLNHDGRRVPLKAADRSKRSGEYPYYGASGIIDDIDDYLFDGEFLLIAEDGANLVSRSTPIAFRASGRFWVNNHAHVIETREDIPLQYLEYYLNGISLQFYITGTAQPKLNQVNLNRISVPVAPHEEQRRIVAKIEELFSDLDAGVAALERAKANLKRYRAAVLEAAVEGKLTEQWRAEHPDVEPASELLQRILADRRQRWEQDQLAKYEAKGKKPPKAWKEKYKEPAKPETSNLPELPDGWCWATVEQLASDQPRSIQSGPFGSNLLHSEFQEQGILAIGIDNTLDGQFSMGAENRISEQKFSELRKYQARPLDVLVTVMATVGRCCVVPPDTETAIITKHVYRLSMNHDLANPHYVQLCLSGGPAVRRQMFEEVRGQTRPGINGSVLKKVAIPVPPYCEQERIISEAQRLLSVTDKVTSALSQTKGRSARLRQAILKRAFEGKLVPQDSNDEPASELLARIRAEREVAEAKRPRAKGRRRRKAEES
ncbi:restriction endonuclease subunit S [Maioricimonas sp. JC845]|uniref:restriction endonuclease subunit S n=1 Tax=Maioricimonas sp. JC845 TaxID=3232138 RepID=UPI003458E1A8